MASELVSTDEVVNALLEYLVSPRLPLKSSAFKEAPTLSQQQSVAKQLHAVVLLCNYYQRKQNPQAQYLDFESFCKLIVTLKPALVSYMKFMNQSNPTASKDMDNDLSVTEKAIQDACKISCALDASKDIPSINKWLIAEVSVLLLDSKKETCWLDYSSVTEGVWSLLEKCLELPTAEIEGTVQSKHLHKKRRASMRPVPVEQNDDDSGFQQLAFLAVKDATGISRSDLVLLEKHVVYSLTKEKTASCFYIMQCTKSIDQDIQIPVKDIFESLQGPLVKRSSGSWSTTEVVEYFHLLPYASIMSTFLLREVSCLEGSNTRSHKDITDNCENEISESRISLFDQNLGNVSITTPIGSESARTNVVKDMYVRNANPANSFSAEVVASNSCERNTGDQKDFGKENGVHHHHESVKAYGSVGGKSNEASASKGSQSVEEKIEKMEAKTPDERCEAVIGTKSNCHANIRPRYGSVSGKSNEVSASKGSQSVEEKIEKMEAKTADERYEAGIGTKSDCHANIRPQYGSVSGKSNEASANKGSPSVEEKMEAKTPDERYETVTGTKSDCHANIRPRYGSVSGKSNEASASKVSQSVEEKIEKMEAKTPDERYEAVIGTKSDHINPEIPELKNGDGGHEKVSHSAVGQEATAVGGLHSSRKSEEDGRGSSIKNTEIAGFCGDKLTGVNLKCLNDTSNMKHHENSRDHEDSTVKNPHGIINYPRTSEERTEELVKSTKICEINDNNDMELAGVHLEPLAVKINDDYNFSSSPARPQTIDIDACIPYSKNGNNSMDSKLIQEVYHHQKKRTRESGGEIIGSGIICKAQRTNEGKADKERDLSSISPNQNGIFMAHTGLVPHKDESTDIGDLQTVLASKEKALTQSSLEVPHKRQKLAQRTDEGKADKERDLSTISPNQSGIFVAHTGLVPHKDESMDIGNLQTVLASKEKALTQSSLEVLLHKRQKLCHQLHKIEADIALCDKSIQGILDGGKDSLALKLETVLDFCDEVCLKDRAAIQEDDHQFHEKFGLIQPMSGRKLSKAVHTP